MTDPVGTPDEILQDDETEGAGGRASKDDEISDVDAIIEENTSVTGADPEAGLDPARVEHQGPG